MMKLFAILLAVVGTLCGCTPSDSEKFPFPKSNASFAEVREMAEEGYCEIERDIVIVGRVVSSDSTGNFTQRVVVTDLTASAELLTGFYDNYLFMPEGTSIAIHLRGLAIDIDPESGILRVGIPADNGTTLTPQMIASAALWRQLATIGPHSERIPPVEYRLGEPFEHLVGRLVSVREVSLATPDSTTWCGVQLFRNAEDNPLWVNTNPDATFARDTIPHTPLNLQGILYTYENEPCIVSF